ncbi:LysR family transcriptional regulator [Ampullimonas aquatilis]|uniref:LysR family transcriptional regulator n=1 Tax=Ampullimonas aquatilis TaxID=1341549 RepID=UPI003C751BB4
MMRSFDPVQLGSIELFCKAAELEGFTAAAKALGVTVAAVSRSVARLEERLGARLFSRSTRQIRLTAEGRAYYEQCREALAQIEQAEQAITGNQAEPTGLLRISIPTTYAHFRVLPVLPDFLAQYPKLKVEVDISNHNIDFVEQGYDLAIRVGTPQDSRLIARRLEEATLGIFAAPSYLQKNGIPQTLAQLREHECIQFVLPSSGRGLPWIVRDSLACHNKTGSKAHSTQSSGHDVDFNFDSRIRFQDDVLGCLNYARAGGGLVQIYHFIAQQFVDRGELVEVLPQLRGRTRTFSLLYPQNRHLSAKVRAFVQFMLAQLA